MGWKPFRTPIIWRKSEAEGLAPWGREGFRRTYEMIFFATKGKKGLLQSPVDILDESRVARHKRRYGPEKPTGLLEQLIECSTLPGNYILNPCCGAGSTLIAARHLKRRCLGIELDRVPYNLAVVAAERDPEPAERTTPECSLISGTAPPAPETPPSWWWAKPGAVRSSRPGPPSWAKAAKSCAGC